MTADTIELTTRTGLVVRVRQARSSDDAALRAGFAHLSEDSRYTRFFTAVPQLSGSLLRQLTDLDGEHRLAFAVFDPARDSEVGAPDGYGIAVARWIRPDPDVAVAELAVAIIDDYQGRGLGHLLMVGLLVAAERHGVEQLEAFVLASNTAMTRLLTDHGAVERILDDPDPGVRCFVLPVAEALGLATADPGVIAAFAGIA